MQNDQDFLVINGQNFSSRLLHCFGSINGDGSVDDTIDAKTAVDFIKESETDFLTIYTQGDLSEIKSLDDFPVGYSGLKYKDIKEHINPEDFQFLVNTNHALTVDEAINRAEIGHKYSGSKWIKLEVLNKQLTAPINSDVIKASKILLDKGYLVLPLINANIEDMKDLEAVGCSAIRVMMSDIGSEGGLRNRKEFTDICNSVKIPVIAEGGLRGPEDGYNAMICGASAVLTNKALFCYKCPLRFLNLLKESIICGRKGYLCNKHRHDS